MKKIFKSILMFIPVFAFFSCDLDKLPETEYTDSSYWKTENDLRSACNKLYDDLAGFYYASNPRDHENKIVQADRSWHDSRSDELVKTSADEVSAGFRVAPSTSRNEWGNPYTRIFNANNVIDKAPRAEVSEGVLNRYVAEARFFRAYQYFQMVKFYGDVPLILKSFDDPEDPAMYAGRSPREEVIRQCYEDLEFAAEWLPTRATLPEADWGRVTRSAALGMMVRIGLYEGTYGKYHNLGGDYRSHLKKSIDAAEALMREGHALYSDFEKLFTFAGEGSKNLENVFVKVYGPNGAGVVVHGRSRTMENMYSVTRNIIDNFLYSDGLPRTKSLLKIYPETSFDDVFHNRDPRLTMSVFRLGEIAYKGAYIPFVHQHGNGYSIKKGYMEEEWLTNSNETVDNMIIRYAEILQSYAEALYEYNGSITNDQLNATINKLRERVGFDVKLTNEFVSANGLDMLEEIRRERTAEFLDEGFRYDDIIRWKIAEDVLPTYIIGGKFVDSETTKQRSDLQNRLTDANGMFNGVKVYDEADMYVIEIGSDRRFSPERDYLYPIPINEIVLSNGSITSNNPNW